VVDTAGLTPEQTALANRLAQSIRRLPPETIAAIHGLLDATTPQPKPRLRRAARRAMQGMMTPRPARLPTARRAAALIRAAFATLSAPVDPPPSARRETGANLAAILAAGGGEPASNRRARCSASASGR
jgi:hypothetical protein